MWERGNNERHIKKFQKAVESAKTFATFCILNEIWHFRYMYILKWDLLTLTFTDLRLPTEPLH